MPAHKKKHTTPDSHLTTTEATSPSLPGQQEFHEHLRTLIRGATRVVMEEVMEEELSLFLRAEWGESTPFRQGYRNGSYTRDLVTATGRIEDLAEESKEGWLSILQDIRTRGATQVDLFVTDGHDGRLSAVSALFTATPRQRCLVQKQRNILNAIPRREREEVQTELVGIWKQEKLELFLLSWQRFWRARVLCFMQNGANMRRRCADQSDGSEKVHHASGGLRSASAFIKGSSCCER